MATPLTDIVGRHCSRGGYDRKPCGAGQAQARMGDLELSGQDFELRVRDDISNLDGRALANRQHLLKELERKGVCSIIVGSKFYPGQRRKESIIQRVKFTRAKGCEEKKGLESIIGATCKVSISAARVMLGRDKYGVLFEEIDVGAPSAQSQGPVHPRVAGEARRQAAQLDAMGAQMKEQAALIERLLAAQTPPPAEQEKEDDTAEVFEPFAETKSKKKKRGR